jgi:hypothetical protein
MGVRDERTQDLFLLDMSPGLPTEEGQVRFTNTDIKAYVGGAVYSLISGSGLTAEQHKVLRQLIHFIDDGPAEGFASGAYKETTPSGPFPTLEVWWESAAKLKKIVQLATTWTGVNITAEQWKVYDVDGSTVLATVTDAITYSGVFESSRTRTITVP